MASITSVPIATVPDLDPGPGQFTPEHIQTPYGVYSITIKYQNDQGKRMMPIGKLPTSATKSIAIVSLFSPCCKKFVEWQASREGDYPLVPNAFDPDPNLTLLANDYWFIDPKRMADGFTLNYGMGGIYIYAVNNPVQQGGGFALAFPPYQVNTGERMPEANFVDTIINTQ